MNAIFSRLPPSGGTWKYAKAPSAKKNWRDSLPIDMLLSDVSVLVVAQSSSEIPEGLMNNPVQNCYATYTNLSYDNRFLIKYIRKMKLHVRYSYKPYLTDMGQILFRRKSLNSNPKYHFFF